MNKLHINLILPFPVTKPVGGAKIMYEYANRLQERGHDVHIFHSIKRPFKRSSTPLWYKQLVFALRGVARPKWFDLHKGIKSVIVPAITGRYLPDADICMSTWWQMTYALNELPDSKGKKFNLIQDYEIWGGEQEKVDVSFSFPLNHVVIATYLQKLVAEKNGIKPVYIPNGIDGDQFFLKTAIIKRDPFSVIMLYSEEPRKDTATGIKTLELIQKKFPRLQVQLFGVYPPPSGLPGFCKYVQKPQNLNELYNKSAIFFSPSLSEGFGLPVAEAMSCGCAVVCTNIGGHPDFAIDRETALLVQPGQVNDMAEKIMQLLENNQLRMKLAETGNKLIGTKFNWSQSVSRLESCFYEAMKK